MKILCKAAIIILASALTAQAELHRGIWFWGTTNVPSATPGAPDEPSAYGSIPVVGDGAKEDETINFFTTYGVKRVYGSYQNRPLTDPSTIAAWNTKLDTAGIQSQLLVDGNAVNNGVWMAALLVKIDNRLINFNNSLGADEPSKFKALHLDLEPQGLSLWSNHLDKRARY